MPEVIVVIDGLVTNLNNIAWTLTLQLLSHNRIQNRLDGVHLLDNQRLAKSHSQLQLSCEVAILVVDHLELLVRHMVLEPAGGAVRRVNQHHTVQTLQDYDGILHAELVRGQSLIYSVHFSGF